MNKHLVRVYQEIRRLDHNIKNSSSAYRAAVVMLSMAGGKFRTYRGAARYTGYTRGECRRLCPA